jgi:uncharacterized protein
VALVLIDTNVLVAAARPDDDLHQPAVPLLRSLRADAHRLLVPPTVVAEVCYMLSTWGGAGSEAAFLRSFGGRGLELAELHETDLARIAELVEQYADLGLGGTDASIIALAERLAIERVATFDRRHFSVVRPAHVEALTLLP